MLANDPVGQREVVGGFWQELKDWDSQMAEQSAMLANDPQAAASARRRQEDRENGQMFGNDPRVERSRAFFWPAHCLRAQADQREHRLTCSRRPRPADRRLTDDAQTAIQTKTPTDRGRQTGHPDQLADSTKSCKPRGPLAGLWHASRKRCCEADQTDHAEQLHTATEHDTDRPLAFF